MMRPLRLAELHEPLAATLLGGDAQILGVSTDSRNISKGDLFVALRGPNFDGHDYLAQVEKLGAAAAITSELADIALPQLRVQDTQAALGHLGAYNRGLFTGPLVAITGSSGKTTVKNMLHAVLSQAGETLATQDNFNNEIGVPLTLLRLHDSVQYAVVEMGAAKAGDIAWLCQLGKPTVALLLNAMPAHLEGFGSVEDVAAAKGEIFDDLSAGDVAIINADQPWAKQWRKRAGAATIVDFGLENPAAITARDIHLNAVDGVSFTASTGQGDIAVRLALPGRHNVANALAAIAAGLACGLSLTAIRDGLESLQPVAGRLRVQQSKSGAAIIDDCYNANPGSVSAAIEMLAQCNGRTVLVLGAMGELGERSAQLHREVGVLAADKGISLLVGVGEELKETVEAFGAGGSHCTSRDAAIALLEKELKVGDTALVKGSRSTGMEKVLHALVGATVPQEQQSC